MSTRITILGAGFGGMELSTMLSEALGDKVAGDADRQGRCVHLRLLQAGRDVRPRRAGRRAPALQQFREAGRPSAARNGHGHRPGHAARDHRRRHARCRLSWSSPSAPTTTSPRRRGWRPRTSSIRSPARTACATSCPTFSKGHAIVGVCGAPYKCPPAPSECVLMLHDYLLKRGHSQQCEITLVLPAAEPRAPVSRDLQGPDRRVRRARHQVHAEPARGVGGRCAPRRNARRRHRHALRPLPRRAQASRAGRGRGRRDGRRRLGDREPEDARDEVPERLRRGRHREHGHAEGRRVCRGRRQGGRDRAHLAHPRRGRHQALRRAQAPATSNSAPAGSVASTSTSFRGRSPPARTTRRAWHCARTRNTSARAARRGGSGSDARRFTTFLLLTPGIHANVDWLRGATPERQRSQA